MRIQFKFLFIVTIVYSANLFAQNRLNEIELDFVKKGISISHQIGDKNIKMILSYTIE